MRADHDSPAETAAPGGGDPGAWRLFRLLARVEEAACVLLTLVLVAAVGAQVLFRYGLRAPLVWTDELSRYAVVWLTFLGAALTSARGGHVAVELGDRLLGRRGVLAVSLFAALVVAGAAAVVVAASLGPLEQAARRTSVALGVPVWLLTLAAPVGFALMGLHALEGAAARLTRRDAARAAPRGLL